MLESFGFVFLNVCFSFFFFWVGGCFGLLVIIVYLQFLEVQVVLFLEGVICVRVCVYVYVCVKGCNVNKDLIFWFGYFVDLFGVNVSLYLGFSV